MWKSPRSGRAIGSRIGCREANNRPVMEQMERRRLMTATVSSWSDSSVTSLAGDYFGYVGFGDNGGMYGCPTMMVGSGGQTTGWSDPMWDSNLSDGLDSGYVPFEMELNADGSGGGSMGVDTTDGTSVANFSGDPSGSISQVTLQAAVESGSMMMAWQDVTVYFYSGGQLVDTVQVGSFSASTLDSPDSGGTESIVSINTNASSCDGVRIVGSVRLVAANGTYPSPTDIFGQVAIS